MIVLVLRVLRYVIVVVICVVYAVLQAGVKPGAKFASTDARSKYGGKGVENKSGTKLKANFSTPLVPKSNRKVSVNCGDGGSSVKGEKSKVMAVGGAASDFGG